METFSVLLAPCAGFLPVTGEFPSQRARKAGFAVFFDVSLTKWLHKQLRAGDLRRHDGHCDVTVMTWRRQAMLTYCQMGHWQQTSVEFENKKKKNPRKAFEYIVY